jgi:anti-sigma regulatory factor (Ser/Thr protein kinase)
MAIYAGSNGNNCMMLAATLNAAGTARRYVSSVLERWETQQVEGVVHLLVTEMVTNAIKATGIPVPDPTYGQIYRDVKPIFLCVYRYKAFVVIEVWDASREVPVRRNPAEDEESGRGVLLIQEIADGYGVRWPKTGGKVVWCSVHTGADV